MPWVISLPPGAGAVPDKKERWGQCILSPLASVYRCGLGEPKDLNKAKTLKDEAIAKFEEASRPWRGLGSISVVRGFSSPELSDPRWRDFIAVAPALIPP